MACIREPSLLPGATCTVYIAGTFFTGEEMGLDEGLGPIGNQQGPCTLRELVSDSGIPPRPLPGDTPWRETEGQNRKYNAQGMTGETEDPQGQEAGSLRMVGLAWAGHVCGLRFTLLHPILPTPGRQESEC